MAKMNLADFNRAIESELRKKVDPAINEAVIFSTRVTYEEILRLWPAYTYWSLANHRISITGRDVVKLEPRTRPEERGALIGKAATENAKELAKLDRLTPLKRARNVVIGNAVPYAPDVGDQDNPRGTGRLIYEVAARIGREKAAAAFK